MPRKKTSTEYEKYSTVKVFNTVFAERLSALIKQKKDKICKERLCLDLGVTKRTIELWEARQSRPDIDRLAELADYFSVTVDYLVGRSEFPAPTLEMEFFSKLTGLSIESQKILSEFISNSMEKTAENSNTQVLNALICDTAFWNLLDLIHYYAHCKTNPFEYNSPEHKKLIGTANRYFFELKDVASKPERLISVRRFMALECIGEIIDRIADKLKEKLKEQEEYNNGKHGVNPINTLGGTHIIEQEES